ncbi:hypothetical protein Hanom_Chr11g01025471 [Helianthus anomalus]
MSLYWRMEREDKPVYMEGDNFVSLYVVAYKREGGKMATIPKKADEELWYLQIVRNFALPRDEDLSTQPLTGVVRELTNLGIGPEKKKCAPAAKIALKKTDTAKAQSSKVKNVKGEKKGVRHFSDSWCDYVVVSDSLEGLAPVVMKKPMTKPLDIADIPASNPDDPIDLESSPEPLVKTKAGKRKQVEVEAEAQPAKKAQRRKISRRGNLDAFIAKPPPVNDDLLPSPPCASISEQLESTKVVENEAEKIAEAENPEVEKPVEVGSEKVVDPETTDIDAIHPKSPEVVALDPEKGKSAQEDHVATFPTTAFVFAPVNIERIPARDQGSFAQVILFSDLRVCRDWLQETFPPGEIKFQEGCPHEQTYHTYLKEAATYASTMHHIVREWHSMHKEWVAFEASKKKAAEDEARAALLRAKLEADRAKFESDQKTEEWSVAGWKRKAEAEAALLSEERKRWREICEKDNNEKMD